MIGPVITTLDIVAAGVALFGVHGAWRAASWHDGTAALANAIFISSLIWLALRPFAGLMAGGMQ